MRFFMILMIFFLSHSTTIFCRPTKLEEENESETSEVEYESEESPDDEYLHEDEQTDLDESPEKSIHQDGIQNPDVGEFVNDPRFSSNIQIRNSDNYKKDFETITENESKGRKLGADEYHISDSKYDQNGKYFIDKEKTNNNAAKNVEAETSQVEHEYKSNRDFKTVNEKSSDYSGDLLLRSNKGETNRDDAALRNYAINKNQQYNYHNYHDNRNVDNKFSKNSDYSYHVDRLRRQIPSIVEKTATDGNKVQNENTDFANSNENEILKNIKKLSEQDLEELLNSLPEDKKALLRKIINKREITKKAGAIDENNNLDQSDTSKMEGSFSISSLSSVTDSTESNKNDDNNEGTSTKILYGETNSEKSENKSGGSDDTSTIIEITDANLKDEAKFNTNKEMLKNENKRETYEQEITNENVPLGNLEYDDFDSKKNNNYPVEKEHYNNENSFEPINEALRPQKRDISQEVPLELSSSVKKLEESFPSVKAYEDAELDMEPLIRVKRTELHHRVKKRDLPYLTSDTMSYGTVLENEPDNFESNEFKNQEILGSQSNYAEKESFAQF